MSPCVRVNAVLLAVLAVLPALATPVAAGQPDGCACFYYAALGDGVPERLRACSILVLSPTVEPPRGFNGTVLGYVSISTLGGWEPWAVNVSASPRGRLAGWGEVVYSVCDPAWRSTVLQAVDYVASRGFDGVFLDNLDVAVAANESRCLVSLIGKIRAAHPDLYIMVNRGFEVYDEIRGYIDAVLFEGFPSVYDAATERYRLLSGGELEWADSILESLTRRGAAGPAVYLLAYASPGDARFLDEICRVYREHADGLPLYVADRLLQEPGLCNPCLTPEGSPSTAASTSPGGRPSSAASPVPPEVRAWRAGFIILAAGLAVAVLVWWLATALGRRS